MKKILILSEVDILYSEKNKIHWLIEGLEEAGIPFHIYCLRDTSKGNKRHQESRWPLTYLNTAAENPALVDAFPGEFFARIQKELLHEHYSVIFAYNTLRFGTYFIQKLGLPCVYDLSDDLSHMAAHSSHMPKLISPLVERIAAHYISKSIRLAKKVTVTTPLLFRKFSKQEEKLLMLPNGYQWTAQLSSPLTLQKTEGEQWVVFVGALREWVCLEDVILELHSWPSTMKLLIIGAEGKLQALKDLSRRTGVDNRIIWLGHVPHQNLPVYLSQCDVGIIPFLKSNTTEFSFPLKLVEYLSLGLSVVSTDLTFVKECFGKHIIIKEKAHTWLSAINDALTKKYVSISPEMLENYTWPRIQKRFIEILRDVQN